jgi:uncharacterized protein (TIGR02246 family)
VEPDQLRTIERFEDAWNRSDIDAMLTYLTPDMEYVNAGNGYYWRGHAELKAGWTRVLAGGGLKPKPVARTFRQLDRDFAICVTRYQIELPANQSQPAAPRITEAVSTFVLARQRDGWLITHSQSTMAAPR